MGGMQFVSCQQLSTCSFIQREQLKSFKIYVQLNQELGIVLSQKLACELSFFRDQWHSP